MNRLSYFLIGLFFTCIISVVTVNADDPTPTSEQKPAEQQATEQQPASAPETPSAEQKPEEQKPTATQPETTPESATIPETKKEWKTFEVKSSPLKIDVTVTGTVWSDQMSVLNLKVKAWENFQIETVVQHGQSVKKGDVLIRFKREDYDRALVDLTLETELAEVAYLKALNQQKVADVTFAVTKKNMARRKKEKVKGREIYYQKDVGFNERAFLLTMDTANQTFNNVKSELEQLSRMYEANEMTEQSEEIVLQRQRLAYKLAELELDRAKSRFEWRKEMLQPFVKEDYEDDYQKEMAQLEAEIANIPLTERAIVAERKQVEITYQKALRKLEKFKSDAQWFEMKAPYDGIVYFGALENGAWSNYAKFLLLLVEGGTIPTKTPFMTVVNVDKTYLRFNLGEENFSKVLPRQIGYFVPTAMPETEIPFQVNTLERVISGSGFYGTAEMMPEPGISNLFPGLKGKMTIATIRKANALMISETAIERDDELKRFVYVLDEGTNTPVRRYVKVGFKKDSQVEILDGLEAGMKILEDPKTAE